MNVILPPPEADPKALREAARANALDDAQARAVAVLVHLAEIVETCRGTVDDTVLLDLFVATWRGERRRLAGGGSS